MHCAWSLFVSCRSGYRLTSLRVTVPRHSKLCLSLNDLFDKNRKHHKPSAYYTSAINRNRVASGMHCSAKDIGPTSHLEHMADVSGSACRWRCSHFSVVHPRRSCTLSPMYQRRTPTVCRGASYRFYASASDKSKWWLHLEYCFSTYLVESHSQS